MNDAAVFSLDAEIEDIAAQCRAHGKDSSAAECPMMEMDGGRLNLEKPFECPLGFSICCACVKKSDWDAVLLNG